MKATRDTLIADVVKASPQAAFVLTQYGFHCVGCLASAHETFAQGAQAHGMSDEELDEMLDDLNLFLAEEKKV